jgi:sterol desaturase/sphingolipid hydroxylase (fatty acid hydroxylase superfamily)
MVVDQTIETFLRLGVFLSVLTLVASLEATYPRRPRQNPRFLRWRTNIGISVFNQILTRLVIPISATALAIVCAQNQWGILHYVGLPSLIELGLAVLFLDLIIYWQHRIYHLIPVLWRFHRMHHADTEFDVTTGIRFHPGSILLSALIKLAAILLLGPSVYAVIIFEVLLNATSLFNHSNLRIPVPIDQILRRIVVTPDMHRVHHSTATDELNCNFGFNFPWWDRLFGSYLDQPSAGHDKMIIGLDSFRGPDELRIWKLLTQPFRNA